MLSRWTTIKGNVVNDFPQKILLKTTTTTTMKITDDNISNDDGDNSNNQPPIRTTQTRSLYDRE
jgi:hypothetical protein